MKPKFRDTRKIECSKTHRVVEQSFDGENWICLHDD